jgi:hypothetical protein
MAETLILITMALAIMAFGHIVERYDLWGYIIAIPTAIIFAGYCFIF